MLYCPLKRHFDIACHDDLIIFLALPRKHKNFVKQGLSFFTNCRICQKIENDSVFYEAVHSFRHIIRPRRLKIVTRTADDFKKILK